VNKQETKICSKCNREKPINTFVRSNCCAECKAKFIRISKAINRVISRPSSDYRCPICDQNEADILSKKYRVHTLTIHKSVWVADHDHMTNDFRGWICTKCNLAIGTLEDSIENLKRAISYLENPMKLSTSQRQAILEAANMSYKPQSTQAQHDGHKRRTNMIKAKCKPAYTSVIRIAEKVQQ